MVKVTEKNYPGQMLGEKVKVKVLTKFQWKTFKHLFLKIKIPLTN